MSWSVFCLMPQRSLSTNRKFWIQYYSLPLQTKRVLLQGYPWGNPYPAAGGSLMRSRKFGFRRALRNTVKPMPILSIGFLYVIECAHSSLGISLTQ